MPELRQPKLNRVLLSGRIGNDIELKYTPKGTPVLRLTLAVDKSYKGADGNWVNDTSWVDCVAWNDTAKYAAQNIRKGSSVIIEGKIDVRQYETEGRKQKAFEIIVETLQCLEKKESGNSAPEPTPTGNDDVPF